MVSWLNAECQAADGGEHDITVLAEPTTYTAYCALAEPGIEQWFWPLVVRSQ